MSGLINASVVEDHYQDQACRHAVVTVLSSLLSYADFGGETLQIVVGARESGNAKRFQAEGVFSSLAQAGTVVDL